MSFFEELKRRNVFRVGIAYGIAAWVVLQVADLVLDNIGSPDWVIQTLMFLVGLGFVAALIIAWAYELTPEGIKREKDVDRDSSVIHHTAKKLDSITLVAVLVLLGFMVLDRFVLEPRAKGSEPFSQTSEQAELLGEGKRDLTPALPIPDSPAVSEKSIAVLPFVDMSADGDQAYFADGIAEEILNVLVKTHSLKVAGRTSSFQFRDRNEDLRLIGEQLGVENILEGSIRKSGNRLRITAQLVKAEDGFHLWSETYDRDLTDIFAVQDEIARAITSALAIELSLDEHQQTLAPVLTTNMEAYDRYLEAKNLLVLRTNFPDMYRLLEEAVERDPNFAAGWATLSQARSLGYYYGIEDLESALAAAEPYARRAIELDPDSSEAHTALANVLRDKYLWNEADDSYQRALELNPDNVEANIQYGQMLIRAGHIQQSLRYGARAIEIDPLSWINQAFYGLSLHMAGDSARGLKALDKAEVLSDFGRSLVVRFKVRMALTEGLKEVARETVRKFKDNPNKNEVAEEFYFIPLIEMLDDPERAREYLNSIEPSTVINMGTAVFWLGYFGEYELAERWTENSLARENRYKEIELTWIEFPAVYPLFSRPVFKELIQRSRLDVYWRKHGWPEFCRPLGAEDFECGMEG